MDTLEKQILEYGQKKDTQSLQNLILNSEEEVIELIQNRVISSNFPKIWKYLLQSISDSIECHEKRIGIVLTLIKELQEREISSSNSLCVVQDICVELPKFKSVHLVEICNICMSSIQSTNESSNMIWKDILPDVLQILTQRDIVDYNGLEYTGAEFKSNFINTLCIGNWSPNIVTSITSMFNDIPLTKEEHLKIVTKLTSYIGRMTPQEIPPFVYQLLRLCRHHNSKIVFIKLNYYFNLRVYINPNFSRPSNSDSPDLDIIENAENHDILDTESTVLFHIHNAAALGHNSIKDYLNSLKNVVKSPEFILQPFQLLVLLTISAIQHYEEMVFDIIRPAVVRSFMEEHKKQCSYFYRDLMLQNCKPEQIFTQVLDIGLHDKELVLQPMVNFGFALLSVGSALGRDIIAEKQWSLGTMILLKIIKYKRHVAPVILKTFTNNIFSRQNAIQYIECLYLLSKSFPLLMMENQSSIVELTESLVQIPGNVGNQLLDALIPLARVLPSIRDQLILVLRKALYSRSVETRQTAVDGFIKLISNTKISNLLILSQSSNSGSFSSGHSLYTQISLNRSTQTVGSSSFSGEAICFEVLGILKRCFIQQAEVRSRLYEGLYYAVSVNPDLGIPVLDVLWFHFLEYYIINEEALPPLNFGKVANLRDTDSVLQEPLGKFVFAISQILTKVQESEEDRDNSTVVKYLQFMESLCNRMINCELIHLELDDGTDLFDTLPESQHKMHILKEALTVYEALIGYKISSWTITSENQGLSINGLMQGYNRFLYFAKVSHKPKKGKKIDVKNTQSQNNTKHNQTRGNNTTKNEIHQRSNSKVFKIPDTILKMSTVDKALKTLLEPSVIWTSNTNAVVIKTKTDLHRHFLHAAMFLVNKVKSEKFIDSEHKKRSYKDITSIANVIYTRILCKFNEYVDFDCPAAILGLECFHAILVIMTGQFKSNISNFLSDIDATNGEEESMLEHLRSLIENFKNLYETAEDNTSDDPDVKKISLIVANILTVLADVIPTNSNVVALQLYDWMKTQANEKAATGKVAGVLMNLLFETHVKHKIGLSLFENISRSLKNCIGGIGEDTTQADNDVTIKIVNAGTYSYIILSLCGNLKAILDDLDNIIARLKSDYSIIIFPGEENIEKKKDDLRVKEKAVSCQLCFVNKILINLTAIAIPAGNLSDAIFKSLMQFYSSLTSLTKYFLTKSSKTNLAFQTARFENLVKLAGKNLAPLVYNLILHIDESQPKENETQAKKKTVDSSVMKSKVLRETRIIPKVIYEIEQFSKTVIQLSKKTKCDLSKYVGSGTVRDFRIKKLKEILEEAGEIDATQASSVAPETLSTTRSGLEENNEQNKESSVPPTKKSRHQ
ncbi:Fanconi anemia group I protein isoform X2 [Cylas formicarius]|uniref:Fanconi anemia group I protein isoform X2 n=1 Tax=Cylas formicarius TaxID=197179 RepID=UPI0029584530|nr:Fanconi anemia group I protein isoform X2 [Cylas formicarius]